jgi:TolB-like protein
LIAAGAWYFLGANRTAPVASNAPPPGAARLSIVVTPFANLSGDPGQDYLVDALTDAVTTSLARLRDTFVIARNTAMTFKGKPIDAKAIGKDLGVRYVLEGSVQPSGDRMSVNAQLVDAGRHSCSRWSSVTPSKADMGRNRKKRNAVPPTGGSRLFDFIAWSRRSV